MSSEAKTYEVCDGIQAKVLPGQRLIGFHDLPFGYPMYFSGDEINKLRAFLDLVKEEHGI